MVWWAKVVLVSGFWMVSGVRLSLFPGIGGFGFFLNRVLMVCWALGLVLFSVWFWLVEWLGSPPLPPWAWLVLVVWWALVVLVPSAEFGFG